MREIEEPEEDFSHWYDEEVHHEAIEPKDYLQALIDEMELQAGDCYEVDGEVNKIHTIDTLCGNIVVLDPTVDQPIDARAGTWEVSILDLYRDWRQGKCVPTQLQVKAHA